jgi:hypothetical protein
VNGDRQVLASDPVAVICQQVALVAPELDRDVVAAAVAAGTGTRVGQRRLAAELLSDPGLLTCGQPRLSRPVQALVAALVEVGASTLARPACPGCGHIVVLVERDADLWICASCAARRRRNGQGACAGCGDRQRAIALRHPDGRALCRRCAPRAPDDPLAALTAAIAAAGIGDTTAIDQAVTEIAPDPAAQHKLLLEIAAHPGRLTGDGDGGSARLNRLIPALLGAGACGVTAPACPGCARAVPLLFRGPSGRVCRRCYEDARRAPCARCGVSAVIAGHALVDDAPLCRTCLAGDAANTGRCTGCGQDKALIHRAADSGWCRSCRRAATAVCSICGAIKPCHFADGLAPRCENCSRPKAPCSVCGRIRDIHRRTDGQPLCYDCARARLPCTVCSRTMPIVGRDADGGPLCKRCYRKHPAGQHPCSRCHTVTRLHGFGLCPHCTLDDRLAQLLPADADRGIRELLRSSDPERTLDWLSRSRSAQILHRIGQGQRIDHAALDALLPDKAVHHLRAVLVAAGHLPDRDEVLASAERRTAALLAAVDDPEHQKILSTFTRWRLLPHLRRRPAPRTRGQADTVVDCLRQATAMLTWLAGIGKDLGHARQDDIDTWLAAGSAKRTTIQTFVTWAVATGHARDLAVITSQAAPPIPDLDDDTRWSLARRLLHDDHFAPTDRLAGLLVVLFAQKTTTIAMLTRDQVTISDDGVATVTLGNAPLELPPAITPVVETLISATHGHGVIGRSAPNPWLFPGLRPGQHISTGRLAIRLQTIGIDPRPTRIAAIADIARQIPASSPGSWASRSTRQPDGANSQAPTTAATPPTSPDEDPPKTPPTDTPSQLLRNLEYPSLPVSSRNRSVARSLTSFSSTPGWAAKSKSDSVQGSGRQANRSREASLRASVASTSTSSSRSSAAVVDSPSARAASSTRFSASAAVLSLR